MSFVIVAMLFVCISMFMLVIRAVLGPTIFDRILAANVFGTNAVVLILLIAYGSNSPSFIDMALVYVLLNFTATIGFLGFFKLGKFNTDDAE